MSIVVKSLTYVHPDRETLFENINFSVARGDRAALVGNNGVGKSTILQVIAGRLQPTAGEIITSDAVLYIPQHLGQYDQLSISEALRVDKKLRALHAILDGDASTDNFTNLGDEWDIEEKIQHALEFWRLDYLNISQTMNTLSGGEKTKVFLAGILLHSPEIVLLDEPSNHLDGFGRSQLYDFITKTKATVLLVSHDRALLNLTGTTLDLGKNKVEVYGGNYDFYKEQKDTQLESLLSQIDEKEKNLKRARENARDIAEQRQKKEVRGKIRGQSQSLPRIIAGGLKRNAEQSTARLQNTHNQKISDVTDNVKEMRQQIQQHLVLKIDLKHSNLHKGKLLIDAKQISFRYGEKDLWKGLSFQVHSGDRIHIEGRNGSGKTTLLSMITGKFRPTAGQFFRADFDYLYLDQKYTLIDPNVSLFEQVQKFNSRNLAEHELKSMLHYYQFPGDTWDRKCTGLSGGEKMKLSLCCLAVNNHTPDVLILDEPTNNLDIKSLEVLTLAVKSFNGTLLVISHDHYFIRDVGIDTHIKVDAL
jgi:ATPase subunit of ABC transporter with duplicated ATPase domains